MPAIIARTTPRPSFVRPKMTGAANLASVLQGGQKSGNIHPISGATRGIPPNPNSRQALELRNGSARRFGERVVVPKADYLAAGVYKPSVRLFPSEIL